MSTNVIERPAGRVPTLANTAPPTAKATNWAWLALAVVLACTMWLYVDRVLVAHQLAEAARTHQPRGNLSDLYPRWLGTQALLVHGRDPYSASVTRDIQIGYWGRALDPNNPKDPKDEGRFAYPLYVVFLLLPTVGLSFAAAQTVFNWVLAFATALSVPLWLHALRIHARRETTALLIILTLGSWPVVQALHLQQLTLLVAALLAGSAAALASGRLQLAGALLAVATIKPQLAAPLAGWYTLWALGDWVKRRRLVWGFAGTLAALVLAGEIVWPGWIGEWILSLGAYVRYTESEPLLQTLFGPVIGLALRYVLAVATVLLCWWKRRLDVGSAGFHAVLVTVLTMNLLIMPTWHSYDQVVLLPAVLWLGFWVFRGSQTAARASARVALVTSAVFLTWSSVTALVLTIISSISPPLADRFHAVPLIAVFALPLAIVMALAFAAYDALRATPDALKPTPVSQAA